MKTLIVSLKMLAVMTLLTGIIYPAIICSYSHLFVSEKANGSLLKKDNKYIGSELIGQNFSSPQFFWPRPSAIDYNAAASGASNLGPISSELKKLVEKRVLFLSKNSTMNIPQDLLFASGSGLDPHISLESAEFQLPRVAKARGVSDSTLHNLLEELAEGPQYGIFGKQRVNVLKLNLAIENLHQ